MKLTLKQIQSWCEPVTFADAMRFAKSGAVSRAEIDGNIVSGDFARKIGTLHCRFRILPDGKIENLCPCYLNQRHGIVCSHAIAVAINLHARQDNPERQQRYIEEQRRAQRLASAPIVPTSPNGTPAKLLLEFPRDITQARVNIRVAFETADGSLFFPESVRKPLRLSEEDATALIVLEDIGDAGLHASMSLSRYDFLSLLDVLRGRTVSVEGKRTMSIAKDAVPFAVAMDIDRKTGDIVLRPKADVPSLKPGSSPKYIVELRKSYVLAGDTLYALKPTLPLPYHGLYAEPISIPRAKVPSFIDGELPSLQKAIGVPFDFELGASPDCFTMTPGEPKFHLVLDGDMSRLWATLRADYYGKTVTACTFEVPGAIAEPDPDDFRHFFGRNMYAERKALALLTTRGFIGGRGDNLDSLRGERNILNVLGSFVPSLRRMGWRVDVTGKAGEYFETAEMAVPVVKIDTSASSSFEVAITYELPYAGEIPAADVQRAINKGENFLDFDGRHILVDTDAIAAMRSVFSDCNGEEGSKPGTFRLPSIYAPYVQSSLNALDGIDVEEPPSWRKRAEQCNRDAKLQPEPLGRLDSVLRPYQKEGVYWMRFLESSGFAGILADEMGLGKTLQTLTWLSLARSSGEAKGLPALVVAPTSLVENWRRECEKFTPEAKCVVMSGAGRHDNWEKVPSADIVITSYALIRRDLEHYDELTFSAAVLDEAQHIKNRSTQNAIAAKRIRAVNKLVLTGTPIENGVADLWSIMDFLMPGYLGDYPSFRACYELPISVGDAAADEAQQRLHRKLRPFLLRRLKRDVAKDLPAKIQKISFTKLTEDQERIYGSLVEVFRQRIGDMVKSKGGFDKCRMEVLAILLRLRQACCHLSLLPPEMLGSRPVKAPSAKTEQFLDLLDEAIDGGHRILVFSQFVQMLKILRQELEKRNVKYCYLDGQTENRVEECRKFNQDPSIPVFLISLKAGGTGLNLTGADMVVHFDPWWNPAVEDQATDRAHRIGQKRTVIAVKLITEGTIEEKVLELQQKKQAVIRSTIGIEDPIASSLTWEDVQSLLS